MIEALPLYANGIRTTVRSPRSEPVTISGKAAIADTQSWAGCSNAVEPDHHVDDARPTTQAGSTQARAAISSR